MQEQVGHTTPTLFGIASPGGGSPNQLITISTATGAGTLVGNLGFAPPGFGLSDRNGILYTFDQQADMIKQLDATTGPIIDVIDVGISAIGEGGIAFRSDGLGFLAGGSESTGNTLWNFDITTGMNNNITGLNGLVPFMDGLDFNGSDILFGLSQAACPGCTSNPELYTINQITGVTALVGDTGVVGSITGGLPFRTDGALFAAINPDPKIIIAAYCTLGLAPLGKTRW